ncbi:hypothetical protein NFI96_020570 [Prochilodus magdalenae]|nr:hypothetical protein NFI96_020570 [Prochilodus magdalenae]
MASSSSIVSEEQLLCSICLNVFTDPVSTPCGHNFCKKCLEGYWDSSDHWRCPLCNKSFENRPDLSVNTFISETAIQFRKSAELNASGAEDDHPTELTTVLCDVCTGVKKKSVKSCLNCGVSYCRTHLKPHKNTQILQKHKLIEPVENLQDYICQKHERPLELFCRFEQTFVCQFCTEGDHKTHNTVPIEEARSELKAQVKKTQIQVQKMIQDRLEKTERFKHSLELSKKSTDDKTASGVEVFTALGRSIERSQAELLEVMEEKQKAAERQAEDLIKELEQEITELQRRDTELEQISHTEDHLHLLQICPSLCRTPHTKDWADIHLTTHSSEEILRTSLLQLQKTLKDIMDKEIHQLKQTGEQKEAGWGLILLMIIMFAICFMSCNLWVLFYAVDVTLDPDTANNILILSDDGKEVRGSDTWFDVSDTRHHKRFESDPCILAKEAFSSGSFYYEVQQLQKLGVFVDYEKGLVSFYDVEVFGSKSLIYSFTDQSFTEKLYPFFCPGYGPKFQMDAPLREALCQFKRSDLDKPEVLCDVCTGVKLKGLKSCLVCLTSYCKPHLYPHEQVPALKRHKLIDPVENLEDYICQKHKRPLELFCRDDQICVCDFCTNTDHKTHKAVPIKEESEEKKTQLGQMQASVQWMIHERLKKLQMIKHSVELRKRNTEKEKADSAEVFTALIRSIERCQAELLKVMEEKQKAAEKQAEDLIKDLEQEITELQRRDTELEQISHTEDHLHLLQVYPSLCRPPHTNNWTDISIDPHLSVETVRKSLSELQKSLNERLNEAVFRDMKRSNEYTVLWSFSVDVILDVDTAHPNLILSDDGKQVRHTCRQQNRPGDSQRFDTCFNVLGKEGFSSDRFYYEVQVRDKTEWVLGVSRESINRKGQITLSPENGFWTVSLRKGNKYDANDITLVPLYPREKLQRVGVFVDYEEGLVSFYNVEARSHVYSFTGQSFTEKLYPFFSPGSNDGGKNSAPLIISLLSKK